MPNILNPFDASKQSHDVAPVERHGRSMRLRGPLPITQGSPLQLELEGEHLLGDVISSVAQTGHFDVQLQVREDLRASGQPGPGWDRSDSDESVTASLIALGARLEFYAERQRSRADGVRPQAE